jgi:hypothetical protein
MGEAPQDYTVQAIAPDGKVTIIGFGQPLDLLPKGQSVAAGQQLRGWLNEQGKYGPYLKVAEERSNGKSPSRRQLSLQLPAATSTPTPFSPWRSSSMTSSLHRPAHPRRLLMGQRPVRPEARVR